MMASSSSSSEARAYRPGVWFTDENFGKVLLRNTCGFMAEISLHGGQVTSWKNARGEELLFLSKKAVYKAREPIRGGIPICFPKLPHHGVPRDMGPFATNNMWETDAESSFNPSTPEYEAFIDLILKPVPHTYFPHKFELRLHVFLNPSGKLVMTTRVRNINTNGKPFSFTFAYHTYLSVSDIGEVRVEDLETLNYIDNLQNKQRCTEQDLSVTFESEVDRVYLSTPNSVTVMDHRKRRSITIRKTTGLPDVVVWNPWNKKAKAMTDLANDEYNRMLCVGPACVETPITLRPGEEWKGVQELSVANF